MSIKRLKTISTSRSVFLSVAMCLVVSLTVFTSKNSPVAGFVTIRERILEKLVKDGSLYPIKVWKPVLKVISCLDCVIHGKNHVYNPTPFIEEKITCFWSNESHCRMKLKHLDNPRWCPTALTIWTLLGLEVLTI